jgi:hypothetical protein
MNRSLILVAFATVVLAVAPRASAALMTFNSLQPSNESIPPFSSYTEDGITLFAADGPPDHFHPQFSSLNSTPAAAVFHTDGFPQRIIFGDGAPFSLVSLDVARTLTINERYRFTSSKGASLDVRSRGPVIFGEGFHNVTYVQLDTVSTFNNHIIIDNIFVVPEPAAVIPAALALTCLLPPRGRSR